MLLESGIMQDLVFVFIFCLVLFFIARMYFSSEAKKAELAADIRLKEAEMKEQFGIEKAQIYANRDITAAKFESQIYNDGNKSEEDGLSQIMQYLPMIMPLLNKGGAPAASSSAPDISSILANLDSEMIKSLVSKLGDSSGGEKKT